MTSTRVLATRSADRPLARDLDEQTGLGEVYLRGLMRAQLRLALTVLISGALILSGLPLVFTLIRATRASTLLGIPLPWFVLGIGVYPVALAVSRYYVRASERIERQFIELATTSQGQPRGREPRSRGGRRR
ncbi:MAG: hypothetical protein ACK5MP_14220 [Nostocoides sp.]